MKKISKIITIKKKKKKNDGLKWMKKRIISNCKKKSLRICGKKKKTLKICENYLLKKKSFFTTKNWKENFFLKFWVDEPCKNKKQKRFKKKKKS